MNRRYPLSILAVLLLALLLVTVALAGDTTPTAPETPTDCPVGQYLCLTPGTGAYILCSDGVLDIHPQSDGLYIVYCDYASYQAIVPVQER